MLFPIKPSVIPPPPFFFFISQLSEPSRRVGVKFVCFFPCNLSILSCQGSLSSDLWIHLKLPKEPKCIQVWELICLPSPPGADLQHSLPLSLSRKGECVCAGSEGSWALSAVWSLVVRLAINNASESSHFYDPEFLKRVVAFGAFDFLCLNGDIVQLVSVEPQWSLGTFENLRLCFCFRKYTCITWHWEQSKTRARKRCVSNYFLLEFSLSFFKTWDFFFC